MRKRLKVMKNPASNKRGFSLIELIIVIAILAVIAAIAVPNLLDNINKSRMQTDVSNAKLAANSVAQVIAENETYAKFIGQTGITTAYEFDTTVSDPASPNATGAAIIQAAAAMLQSVPSIKYDTGYETAATDHLYVVVTTGGVITVYGDSGSVAAEVLFPEVPSGGDWDPSTL